MRQARSKKAYGQLPQDLQDALPSPADLEQFGVEVVGETGDATALRR